MYDVAIIGAGVSGAAIARSLALPRVGRPARARGGRLLRGLQGQLRHHPRRFPPRARRPEGAPGDPGQPDVRPPAEGAGLPVPPLRHPGGRPERGGDEGGREALRERGAQQDHRHRAGRPRTDAGPGAAPESRRGGRPVRPLRRGDRAVPLRFRPDRERPGQRGGASHRLGRPEAGGRRDLRHRLRRRPARGPLRGQRRGAVRRPGLRPFGAEDFQIVPRKGEEYLLDRGAAACPAR